MLQKINNLFVKILSLIIKFRYSITPRLRFGKRVMFNGWPIITLKEGAKIIIGDDVVINSKNKGYHINMHSPVKLFVDHPEAEIVIGNKTRIHGACLHA